MNSKGVATSVLWATAAWAGLYAPGAMAQQTPASDAQTSDEIIVTASRREQSLQDTALAVNAVTAERLDDAGIASTDALQTAVPNLQYSLGGSGASFIYLRGVGNAVFGTFSDNSVATYIDGAYVPRNTVASQELYDIERIEVLRGPQATLYGRNATGGAVLINTASPSDVLTGSLSATIGNYGDQRYRGMISGPLAAGLNGRLSVVRHVSDGYNTNLADGSDYGGQDFWGARASLSATIFDSIDLLFTANYSQEEGSLGTVKQTDPNTLPFLPPPAGAGTPFSPDPRASYHSLENEHLQEVSGASLRATWDLGFADLISTTSYQRFETGPDFFDLDDSLAPFLEYRGHTEETDFLYQDFLLRSNPSGGRLDWFVGATLVNEETSGLQATQTPGGFNSTVVESSLEGYAVYGQLDLHLTDDLTVVGGVRYSEESREGSAVTGVFPAITNDRTWDDTSPRLALEWRPGENVLLYASATHGFKSGAFDPQNPANAAEPESIWSYELGARTHATDSITFNATLFHYDITDMQLFSGVIVPPFGVRTVLQNAGGGEAGGMELEAAWEPTDNFTIGGFVALLNARYTNGTILADTANAITFPVPSVNIADVGGNAMVQSPETSASVFARWTLPVGELGSVELYADYFYQSERYFSAFEDPTLRADDYDLVNARVTFSPPSERWYIAAFVRNAGDSLVESSMTRVRPFGTLVGYTPPRLNGIEIGARF